MKAFTSDSSVPCPVCGEHGEKFDSQSAWCLDCTLDVMMEQYDDEMEDRRRARLGCDSAGRPWDLRTGGRSRGGVEPELPSFRLPRHAAEVEG